MANCGSCGAEILWITLLTREGGSLHPVDYDPHKEPAERLIAVRRIELHGLCGLVLTAARMEKRLEEFRAKRCKWHSSHFATCPNAQQHRAPQSEALF